MDQDDRSWQQYYADEVRGSNDTIMSFLSHAIGPLESRDVRTAEQYRAFLESKSKLRKHVRDAAKSAHPVLKQAIFDKFYNTLQPLLDKKELKDFKPRLEEYRERFKTIATKFGLGPQLSASQLGALPGPSEVRPASAGDRHRPSLPRIFSPVPVTVGGRELDNDELTAVQALLALNPQPTSAAGGPAQHLRLTITLPPLHTLTSGDEWKNTINRTSASNASHLILQPRLRLRTPPR